MNELELIRLIGIGDDLRELVDVRREARTRLDIVIDGEIAVRQLRRRRRRVRATRGIVGLAATAVLVLLALFLPRGAGGPQEAAASELWRLANAAALQPSGALPAGMVLYAETEGVESREVEILGEGTAWRYLVPVHGEYWRAPGGSGRILEQSGDAEFASPKDEAAWTDAGRPSLPGTDSTRDEKYRRGELKYFELATIERDPHRLADMIVRREIDGSPPGAAYDLNIAADLLRITELSAEGRAAVFRAAALLPGVRSLGETTDHAGRSGIGFAGTSGGRTTTLIFDPLSTALLEEGAEVGGVATWRTYLRTGVVDRISERPQVHPQSRRSAPAATA